jgi:hypothetical protein
MRIGIYRLPRNTDKPPEERVYHQDCVYDVEEDEWEGDPSEGLLEWLDEHIEGPLAEADPDDIGFTIADYVSRYHTLVQRESEVPGEIVKPDEIAESE